METKLITNIKAGAVGMTKDGKRIEFTESYEILGNRVYRSTPKSVSILLLNDELVLFQRGFIEVLETTETIEGQLIINNVWS